MLLLILSVTGSRASVRIRSSAFCKWTLGQLKSQRATSKRDIYTAALCSSLWNKSFKVNPPDLQIMDKQSVVEPSWAWEMSIHSRSLPYTDTSALPACHCWSTLEPASLSLAIPLEHKKTYQHRLDVFPTDFNSFTIYLREGRVFPKSLAYKSVCANHNACHTVIMIQRLPT